MIRRESRHPTSNAQLILYRESSDMDKHRHEYPIQNISRGGLRFSSSDSYEIDERIKISVYLENKEMHQAHARICYCLNGNEHDGNYFYGVSFLDKFVDMSLVN
ncbi:MAG: PilZ domain-containing protein [Gammaproteobacteria bacterium]|nr:PilZ domain-containing protein [Gammaproteobacteria bacterium]